MGNHSHSHSQSHHHPSLSVAPPSAATAEDLQRYQQTKKVTIVGAIIIICVTVGMLTIIPAYWQNFTMGCVLIIAVALNHLLVGEERT